MIIGLGSDIVQIPRIEVLINDQGDRFLERVFSATEIEASHRFPPINPHGKAAFLAKRFAAKEAFVKALGTGIRDGIRFTDISISNDAQGKPLCAVTGGALKALEERTTTPSIHVSLSDDYPVAFATVVIESR